MNKLDYADYFFVHSFGLCSQINDRCSFWLPDCWNDDTRVRDIVIEHNRLESHFRMHNTKDGLV